jgi:hypothetical protein
MPCFHPDNRLFTIKEFRDLRDSNESFRKMWKDYSNDKYGPGWRDLSEELKVDTQDTPTIKTIDNIIYKKIISEEELKTYKGTLEWKDNKKYLILYGTGSYSIATGSREDTDEEIIKAYRETLKKTLR